MLNYCKQKDTDIRTSFPTDCVHIAALVWLVSAVILVFTITAGAQDTADTVTSLPGIEIQTSVDRADVYIGDLITYRLTAIHDSTVELVPPPLGANLGAFDVKDYRSDIRSTLPDGRLQNINEFVLSTFTTGDYVIPPIPVMFILPDSSRKVVLSEGVPIKVNSLLADGTDSADIKPLKPPYVFARGLTWYYIWGGLALVVLIAVASLLWWRRRRRPHTEAPVDLRPPWEIAFELLALLKQKSLVADGAFKQYYIELTELARDFLGQIYEINVLDMTTEEFLFRFTQEQPAPDLHEDISRFLHHADLVKFARLIPPAERADSDFEYVHGMVERLRLERQHRRGEAIGATRADSPEKTEVTAS
ncbi:MAG: hypothetical protein ABII79_04400 [bacterium]